MLVTRQCDTGRNTWSSSKLEAIYHSAASPRMSNFEPLSTQPDWREQYSTFPLSGESGLLQPSFEPSTASNGTEERQAQRIEHVRPALEHRHSLGPLRVETQQAPIVERPESAPGVCGNQVNNDLPRDESHIATEPNALSLGSLASNPFISASSATVPPSTIANNGEENTNIELQEEEDEEDDDDDMLDVEDGSAPQTAAERRAERRKMKRFRYASILYHALTFLQANDRDSLTHQQTRFLMSEFAKQAHPDAAHRERLSREIPGLSPRQVQVWFQNRYVERFSSPTRFLC
jgi:hypothetical protein